MRFYAKKLLVVLVFSLCWFSGKASHIVGGDITAVYNGTVTATSHSYSVTMTYFRDCNGIAYPATVTISVYDLVTNVLQQTFVASPTTTTNLSLGDGCYTPVLCIQKRFYTATITLPNNPNGYYFSYQECCRNAGITNITAPSSAGYVFYTELSDPALQNSTPTFTSEPDGYMCQNYVNTDQFTATDADGDVLVYSLVDPLNGPAGPAPYTPITWVAGYYTTNPLGDPGMIVNSSTGVINTLPPFLGTFVLAMKVEEWRGGVKIGEVRRDFQFEVTNCTLLNLSVSPGNPICMGQTATVSPSGAGAGYSYVWNPGGETTSSIVVTPTATGSYDYTCTATSGPCIKVNYSTLVVNDNPTASVSTTGNICAGENQTLNASGGISYNWSNGSPLSSISVSPGTYTVTVTNSFNCSATATGTISPPVASSYTWTGGGSTGADNWFDSNNWGNAYGCLPNCDADAFIPSTPSANSTNFPDIGTGNGAASCKSLTLSASAKLTFSQTTAELDVCGDFIDHGIILNNGGQRGIIKFMGTQAQLFRRSSSASGNPLYQVIIANTASPIPSVTIEDGTNFQDMPISAFGSFSFTSGILITEGERKLRILNNASGALSGHGPNSYVVGRLERTLAVSTSYDFPVGNMPTYGNPYPYQLMNVNFSDLAGVSNITVSFENPLLTNSTGTGLPVYENPITAQWNTILNNGGPNTGSGYATGAGGLWTIIPDVYAAATYSMTLEGRNYDNQGATEHTILKRNTFCPGIWQANGSYLSSSIAGNVVTASRDNMIGFSQVALAPTSTPLPVELIAFDATCVDNKAKLTWITASELNNNYFLVERSCDENYFQFEEIAKVAGAGNSSVQRKYEFTDKDDLSGQCYYRLSQVDFGGKTEVFETIAINCNSDENFNFIGVVPNPTSGLTSLIFSVKEEVKVEYRITDLTGQVILRDKVSAEPGLNYVQVDLSQYPAGLFFATIQNGEKIYNQKVVKR